MFRCLQLVHNTVKAAEIPGALFHCGVDIRASEIFNSETGTYYLDGPSGSPKTGTELAAYLGTLYVAGEIMTFEDPTLNDVSALKILSAVSAHLCVKSASNRYHHAENYSGGY
jgi:type II secretory ATPase GspE/PulE/Tfp pilus assembly ATPase PilB-like protein